MIVSALRREGAVSRHPRELGEPMDTDRVSGAAARRAPSTFAMRLSRVGSRSGK